MRRKFVELRGKHEIFYMARVALHEKHLEAKVPMIGHDLFGHDHAVAQTCLLIHDDQRAMELAWLAAMVHSLDRLIKNPDSEVIKTRGLLELLKHSGITEEEIEEIWIATRRHDKENSEEDSLIQMILQDADRLANAQSIIILRSGQFTSIVPPVELGFLDFKRNPKGNYKSPASGHDDLLSVLEWDPEGPEALPQYCLRLPKAIEFGRPHFAFVREWIMRVKHDFTVLGLDPWPIE
jgi:hypothetical protein